MTKTVDFTKKVVCSNNEITVLQIISVNYSNSSYKHLIIYERSDGTQNDCAVNFNGRPSSDSEAYDNGWVFSNPEPQIISKMYRNVYPDGYVSAQYFSLLDANMQKMSDRIAVLEHLKYDDNTVKVSIIED